MSVNAQAAARRLGVSAYYKLMSCIFPGLLAIMKLVADVRGNALALTHCKHLCPYTDQVRATNGKYNSQKVNVGSFSQIRNFVLLICFVKQNQLTVCRDVFAKYTLTAMVSVFPVASG